MVEEKSKLVDIGRIVEIRMFLEYLRGKKLDFIAKLFKLSVCGIPTFVFSLTWSFLRFLRTKQFNKMIHTNLRILIY